MCRLLITTIVLLLAALDAGVLGSVHSNSTVLLDYDLSAAPLAPTPTPASRKFLEEDPRRSAAALGKRKRQRSRASKNREELENQRMTHIAVERNRRKQMNEYLAVIKVVEIYTVSNAIPILPINIEDAAKSEAEIQRALENKVQVGSVEQDKRLDNRVLDLQSDVAKKMEEESKEKKKMDKKRLKNSRRLLASPDQQQQQQISPLSCVEEACPPTPHWRSNYGYLAQVIIVSFLLVLGICLLCMIGRFYCWWRANAAHAAVAPEEDGL